MTPDVLIVWHSRTGTAEALAGAAADGANQAFAELSTEPGDHGRVRPVRAADATVDDVLAAHGYVFCCPENLTSMSGEMKEFFDRIYYGALDRVAGRPAVLIVAAGTDGHGVVRQFDRIAAGWRLKPIAPPHVVITGADTAETIAAPKTVAEPDLVMARELGATLAGGLALGIY